jgi:hypothetical protein
MSDPVVVPHFDFPFRLATSGHPAVVEQDTIEDISNCVAAVLLTRVGEREVSPDFGSDDFTFQKQPLDVADAAERILLQEPRANVIFEQHPDQFDQLIARVSVRVSTRQEGGAS